MMPAAAARVRVGVSREAESGVSVKLRDCAVDDGDDLPDVRDGTRVNDADRRFRALRELVGDGRPDARGRELDSHSEAEQSVSSNMVNSASVMSVLSRLLTGTIVVAECEDSARETGRGDRLPDSAPGRMVQWLVIVESLLRQSSLDSLTFSLSCEVPNESVERDVTASPASEGCLEWLDVGSGD